MKYEKFSWKLAVCISLFSFASYVTQPLYSAFVPMLLSKRLSNTTQVGMVLSFCNLLAMLIHPVVGGISDRTRCRFGRRRPYILSGAILCGLSFMVLPWLKTTRQFTIVLVCYSLTLAYWKAPVGAIQIDCVKPEYITRTNAVSSCVLALSSVFAYLSSNYLEASSRDTRWGFMVGGTAAIVTAGIGCLTVHEKDSRKMKLTEKEKRSGALDAFWAIEPRKRKSMMIMFLAIMFAFTANYGFEYFFVLFSEEKLGITAGRAALYLAVYMLSYFIASLWFICTHCPLSAGTLSRIGVGAASAVFWAFFILCCTGNQGLAGILWIVCILHGACWGTFNIYIYPLWLSFQEDGHSGNLMGLFFVCTGLAVTLMPLLYGVIHDISGTYVSVPAFCGTMYLLAWAMLKRSSKFGDFVKTR